MSCMSYTLNASKRWYVYGHLTPHGGPPAGQENAQPKVLGYIEGGYRDTNPIHEAGSDDPKKKVRGALELAKHHFGPGVNISNGTPISQTHTQSQQTFHKVYNPTAPPFGPMTEKNPAGFTGVAESHEYNQYSKNKTGFMAGKVATGSAGVSVSAGKSAIPLAEEADKRMTQSPRPSVKMAPSSSSRPAPGQKRPRPSHPTGNSLPDYDMQTHFPQVTVNVGYLVEDDPHAGMTTNQCIKAMFDEFYSLTDNANIHAEAHDRLEGMSQAAKQASRGANTPEKHAAAAVAHRQVVKALDDHLKGYREVSAVAGGGHGGARSGGNTTAEPGSEAGTAIHGHYVAMRAFHSEKYRGHMANLGGPRERAIMVPPAKGEDEKFDYTSRGPILEPHASVKDWETTVQRVGGKGGAAGYARLVKPAQPSGVFKPFKHPSRTERRQAKGFKGKPSPPTYRDHSPQQ